MKIRDGAGGLYESKGPCSDRKAFAMHMLNMVADLPPLDENATLDQVKFRAAVEVFLAVTEKMRAGFEPVAERRFTKASRAITAQA
jgi:hypothetical protein